MHPLLFMKIRSLDNSNEDTVVWVQEESCE